MAAMHFTPDCLLVSLKLVSELSWYLQAPTRLSCCSQRGTARDIHLLLVSLATAEHLEQPH